MCVAENVLTCPSPSFLLIVCLIFFYFPQLNIKCQKHSSVNMIYLCFLSKGSCIYVYICYQPFVYKSIKLCFLKLPELPFDIWVFFVTAYFFVHLYRNKLKALFLQSHVHSLCLECTSLKTSTQR